jgi:hypothetical protein
LFIFRERPHLDVAQKHKLTPRRWLDLSRAITTFVRFAAHVTPHFIPFNGLLVFCNLKIFFYFDDVHLNLFGCSHLQERVIDRLQIRCFFNSLITVAVLIPKTRAVSRTPLPFKAMSMICRLISGKRPFSE